MTTACVRTAKTDDGFVAITNENCKLCDTPNKANNWCFTGVAKDLDEAQEWCFTGVAREIHESLEDDDSVDKMSVLLTEVAQGDERISPHNEQAWVKDVKRKLKLIGITAV
jgi:hypothetical protein